MDVTSASLSPSRETNCVEGDNAACPLLGHLPSVTINDAACRSAATAIQRQLKAIRCLPPEVPSSHVDLLDAAIATLATIGPDGRPQVSAVWFLADDGVVKVSLNTARQKVKNLTANPAVTVFILDPANPAEVRRDPWRRHARTRSGLRVHRSARRQVRRPDLRAMDGPDGVVSRSPSTRLASTPSTSAPADSRYRVTHPPPSSCSPR